MKRIAFLARRFALGLLAASAVAAQAQPLSCNPATPRSDPGTTFAPFAPYEQLLARGGNQGPAWEWALGLDTETGAHAKGNLDWVSGRVYAWTLTYQPSGAASVEIRHQGALVLAFGYPSGMRAGNALELSVGANGSIGPDTTLAASATSVSGHAVSGAIAQSGTGAEAAQRMYWYFPPMTQGFSASGTVSLTYASLPSGGRVQFRVRAGTITCETPNQPPSVSLTSPASGTTYTTPATIELAATAADADGTVQRVDFYEGANLIGTATSSPYAITWTNVPVGSYTLTARAVDNAGAETVSSQVPLTVSAPTAKLYFIHVDHLNTPRLVADAAGVTVWRWDQQEPFGDSVPNENPSGLGAFDLPLRLPGQRYDAETGLHYNYFRDYDPSIGRYVESDPIGLSGGLDTYSYVLGNPMTNVDFRGLEVTLICRGVDYTDGLFSHCYVHVTCPEDGIDEVLSLFGRAPWGFLGLPSVGFKSSASSMDGGALRDDPSAPNQQRFPVNPRGANCDCRCEKDVIARFHRAPAVQPYGGRSSFNSNTFAQYLITSPSCGMTWPPGTPTNAVGTLPISAGRIR